MGLSEVVDFARNFAVMVRVQGPDPKGLKMRNQAFHHHNLGKTTLSASGMLFMGSLLNSYAGSCSDEKSSGSILVLTVASVIEPFLMQKYRENALKDKAVLIAGVHIDVLVEDKLVGDDENDEANRKSLHWLPAELLNIVDIHQSSSAVQLLIDASYVSMQNGWEVGWYLASHSQGIKQIQGNPHSQVEESLFWNQGNIPGITSSNPSLMVQSATRIALLSVPFKKTMMNFSKLQTSVKRSGDLLLAMGSPFGILSPVHFFNNISVGSISNSYPPISATKSLVMADVRCLPGMEGGPVFDEHAQFVGLLTRPLRQKISGTEIQLVIPWEAIVASCSNLLQEEPHRMQKSFKYNTNSQLSSPVEKAVASICLITTENGSWGSGILLNNQGLVLTNAHILEPWRFGKPHSAGERNVAKSNALETFYGDSSSQNLMSTNLKADVSLSIESTSFGQNDSVNNYQRVIRVRLGFVYPWLWTSASVVYVSKGPLDVALLQVQCSPHQLSPVTVNLSCPASGSKAYIIGNGLLGPRCDFLPSVSVGVVAKVIGAKKGYSKHEPAQQNLPEYFPAMIETTAVVQSGSSGGAVVNEDGHMIGIVTSNAKHGGGMVIPHLNFSIPCAALEPIFKFSRDMQDLLILEELDKPNNPLSLVWAMMPPLDPKPTPLLPDLPQTATEDNAREAKGSRFAKFIAERNQLAKNTGLLGTSTSFSTELIGGSKL